MIFLGFLLGGIAVGPFADKLGRKLTIYVFGFIIGLFSLLTAFPKVYWLFALFRFLIGFGVGKVQLYNIYIYIRAVEGLWMSITQLRTILFFLYNFLKFTEDSRQFIENVPKICPKVVLHFRSFCVFFQGLPKIIEEDTKIFRS